jgi:hypothetical protein
MKPDDRGGASGHAALVLPWHGKWPLGWIVDRRYFVPSPPPWWRWRSRERWRALCIAANLDPAGGPVPCPRKAKESS